MGARSLALAGKTLLTFAGCTRGWAALGATEWNWKWKWS